MEQTLLNLEIEPHSSDPAIILKYDINEPNGVLKKSKIIQLKNLSDEFDCSLLARNVVDNCSVIPVERIGDVEQVIFYLQRRLSSTRDPFTLNGHGVASVRADISKLESYIEMLYEDSEKIKASSYILSLCTRPSNLQIVAENDVLMGALARVFREDSKKNFELATNLSSIFFHLSIFSKFHFVLSQHKIGALTLQIVENELRRSNVWMEQAAQATSSDQRRKWELAMKKQDIFIGECLKTLMCLTAECRVEVKMITRGLLTTLATCLEHTRSSSLTKTAVTFLWKLSVFAENKDAMGQLNVIERLVALVSPTSADVEFNNILFALMLNLSFDVGLRQRMVATGLVNVICPHLRKNDVALALIYQLSISDDAKAMFSFTDSIDVLMSMLRSRASAVNGRPSSAQSSLLLIEGILVNVAMVERNAQLICGPKGVGLDFLFERMQSSGEELLMKVIRNCASHEGPIQQQFIKRISHLFQLAKSADNNPKNPMIVDAVATLASLTSVDWKPIIDLKTVADWAKNLLKTVNNSPPKNFPDEFVIQLVALCGTLAAENTAARHLISASDDFIKLLNRKQEDDEFVFQISFLFSRLLTHADLLRQICDDHSQIIDYLMNLTHDKNAQLRAMCDQALQLVSEVDEHWFKRIAEERFCWHNAQWLDIVEGEGAIQRGFADDEEDSFLSEQFRHAVIGADEILNQQSFMNE